MYQQESEIDPLSLCTFTLMAGLHYKQSESEWYPPYELLPVLKEPFPENAVMYKWYCQKIEKSKSTIIERIEIMDRFGTVYTNDSQKKLMKLTSENSWVMNPALIPADFRFESELFRFFFKH